MAGEDVCEVAEGHDVPVLSGLDYAVSPCEICAITAW
jgi:hypothetical protein